ncbi:radical SAM/SPASM domain-containing protein [Paenibacillus alvei]|uniref:Radical SAM protein n=1 Tax=Paenibacillus alvei TaxID=44250 RepID=A0AAP7A027_PAEAL|nr:radical SAM protein [Paenibacillus alvei]NOJ73113.1 radical SAM protein [Paenibacillus alvei]
MLIHIFTTNKCNLNCEYCYVSGLREKKDFDLKSIDNLILFIKTALKRNNSDKLFVDFFGGEPLLNMVGINLIIEKLRSNLDIEQVYLLTTNGTLLSDKNIEFLAKNKFVLSVSLDGLPETHDLNRKFENKSPSWSIIERNIDNLLQVLPHTTARMTFNTTNVMNLYNNVIFLASRGFKSIKPIPDYFDSNWSNGDFSILQDQVEKIVYFQEENPDLRIPIVKKKLVLQSACTGGHTTFSINTNGDIYPCNYIVGEAQYKLGNINDVDNVKFKHFNRDNESRKKCKGCTYFDSCTSARCIFMNYKMTKDISSPNGFFCAYERLQSSYADV